MELETPQKLSHESFWKSLFSDLQDTGFLRGNSPQALDQPPAFNAHIHLPLAPTGEGLPRQVRLETVLRGAWAVVLARHTGAADVLFFSSFDDRQPWLAPIRIALPAATPISKWLIELEDQLKNAEEHGPVPAHLLTHARYDGLAHSLPTFLVVPPEATAFPPRDQIKGPLLVVVRLDISMIEIHYDSAWFDPTEIEALGDHLNIVLQGMAAAPQSAVGNLPVLTERERRLLLDEWNDTAAPFAENTCVHEFFEEQAARAPDAVAVVFRDSEWTYRELNAQAEIMARRLRSAGVGPGALVAICLNRSLELMAALLAVFKAGGAYVPLDPSYPAERLAFMIDDAKPAVIVVSGQTEALFPLPEQRLLRVDAPGGETGRETIHKNPVPPQSSDPAYVLYTSGSTGKPKGVVVTHRNASNFFTAMDAVISPEPGVWLAVTSINFDISVFELFWTLARGFRVILQEEGPWAAQSGSDYSLPAQLKRHSVTHLQCTPSLASMLICDAESVDALRPLRRFMVGGEPLPLDLAHRLSAIISGDLFNLYGPTETTVWSAAQLVGKQEKQILIGRPVANTRLYVLDAARELVPIGGVGELYIGGDGLAREYLNRPDVTRERFVTHAFSPGRTERLYRTGDLVRHTRDGRLEFMGRIDQQIKIRGVRIELGEIEVVLREHPDVRDAVVVVQENETDDKRLVAYVVPSSQPPSVSDLQQWLGSKLPKVLVPSAIVFLPEFPKTPNGKLDRRALPKPRQQTSRPVEGAANDLERRIAAIWSDVLGVESVGLEERFFDIGGHSLLMIEVHDQLRDKTGRHVALLDLFQYPTVRSLARHLGQRSDEAAGETTGLHRGKLRQQLAARQVSLRKAVPVKESS
ncbi:MAG TPA: amino acid adenylation domain-containing protein [Candidatus Methylacidiphilales bacterium]|jgi:amino acid adenylation domain-containing protein|nr:amino acid adenylation domain-containing protein [Candidatus Methylacidiphilales bacterium]